MKKVLFGLLILLAFTVEVSAGEKAASKLTMSGVAGDWTVATSKLNFAVSSLGASSDSDFLSSCTITSSSDTAGVLDCGDFSGNATIKGKKASWSLDADSKSSLESTIASLASDLASAKDKSLDATTAVVTISKESYVPLNFKKKSGAYTPAKTMFTLKGTIEADIDGETVKKSFTYKTKLKFE